MGMTLSFKAQIMTKVWAFRIFKRPI